MHILLSFDIRAYPHLYKVLKNVLRCPHCGSHHTQVILAGDGHHDEPRFVVFCQNCNHHSKREKDFQDAVASWQMPSPRERFAARLEQFKEKWGCQ